MPAVSRQALLRDGVPRHRIDDELRRGAMRPVRPGYFALDDRWESMLQAHALRGGPGSVISHRAAARLHGFEGWKEFAGVDLIVPPTSTYRRSPAIRSTLAPEDVVVVGALLVTSPVRTIADLGRFLTANQLEVVVEAYLRGEDRRRPDVWHEDRLAAIVERLATTRVRGVATLREVLARRPEGARPTGSYAETIALQALRAHGFGDVLRQPTLTVIDRVHDRRATVFPDLFDVPAILGGEIDGGDHETPEGHRRDIRRDNVLGNVVRLVRYPAVDVLAPDSTFGRDVAREILRRRLHRVDVPGVTIEVRGSNVTIVRA